MSAVVSIFTVYNFTNQILNTKIANYIQGKMKALTY